MDQTNFLKDTSSNSTEEFRDRLNIEWTTINALRETLGFARPTVSPTYEQTLEFAKDFAPSLFSRDRSLLIKARENPIIKEFSEKAEIESKLENRDITAGNLIAAEIEKEQRYIRGGFASDTEQIRKRISKLNQAQTELAFVLPSENQMILRDALKVDRDLPISRDDNRYREYQVSKNRFLNVRLLHPDTPEHATGADVIYEFYWEKQKLVRIIALQYKIWNTKVLYQDERMEKQLAKMRKVFCGSSLCEICDGQRASADFRFPNSIGYIRPTDELQTPDSSLISSGYHIPVCIANKLWEPTKQGKSKKIEADKLRVHSVRQQTFEDLFAASMIGSRWLTYSELANLYEDRSVLSSNERVLIHAQELTIER